MTLTQTQIEIHQRSKAIKARIAAAAAARQKPKEVIFVEDEPKSPPTDEGVKVVLSDGRVGMVPNEAFDYAWSVLNGVVPTTSIEKIIMTVARHFRVSPLDIVSPRRTANVVLPRQVAVYLARDLTVQSLPQIGRKFGNRDHTTILHACRKVTARMKESDEFAAEVRCLSDQITEAVNERA